MAEDKNKKSTEAKKILKKPSEVKSEIASKRERVNGRFVSANPESTDKKNSKVDKPAVETEYIITEEDRLVFGNDSKAFFEWALTKAATRYEAAKYAKELMRFQYPSLQAVEVKQDVEIKDARVQWIWGEAQEVLQIQQQESIKVIDAISNTLQTESSSS